MVGANDRHKYFEPRLDDAFREADSIRNKLVAAKNQAREHPLEVARQVSEGIPAQMQRLRARAAELYGVDIASPEAALKAFKVRDYGGTENFLCHLNMFSVYEECQQELEQHIKDSTLSAEECAAKICEVGAKMVEAVEAVSLHMDRERRVFFGTMGSEGAAKIAKNEEARRLAAHLATRISMKNQTLARALDALREHKKSQSRERFEILLRELYIEAPQVWDEHHDSDLDLRITRNAAAKKIVRRSCGAQSAVTELAAFADKEELLRYAKTLRLGPQELEVFKLYIENPRLKYREIADKLGISTSQVGVIKHRINKKRAAGF